LIEQFAKLAKENEFEEAIGRQIKQEQKKLSLLTDAKISHLQKSDVKLKSSSAQDRFDRWNSTESKLNILKVFAIILITLHLHFYCFVSVFYCFASISFVF
jgi:hypothetical protein